MQCPGRSNRHNSSSGAFPYSSMTARLADKIRFDQPFADQAAQDQRNGNLYQICWNIGNYSCPKSLNKGEFQQMPQPQSTEQIADCYAQQHTSQMQRPFSGPFADENACNQRQEDITNQVSASGV